MLRILLIIYLALLVACKANQTQYYYGEKNVGTFSCYWRHHIVVEDKDDSLRIWNLDDECNAGYWSTGHLTIPKTEGNYGDLTIKKITDSKITLTYDTGNYILKFTLNRQSNQSDAIKVVNITQMLTIDSELEKHIQATTKHAEKNTLYLTENHIADDSAGSLAPGEFYQYYKAKKEKVAETIIKQLATK